VIALITPLIAFSSSANAGLDRRWARRQIDCGYDAQGAWDELSYHKLHTLRRNSLQNSALMGAQAAQTGPLPRDFGDLSVWEDDGTVVIPPNSFSLKNSSVLFTPDGDGYRLSTGGIGFSPDFGSRIGYFLIGENKLGDFDNGYRDVQLAGPQFPFFGVNYDTIYIGTNGYITFTQGDTSARISPSALASDLPRIAPLWADLEFNDSGSIYFNRLDGRYLITWANGGQPSYNGSSTFQAALYDDGRIAFVYKKVKVHAALVGISPGHSTADPQPVDFADPPAERMNGAVFETFAKQKRLDLPALMRAFYRAHSDSFDTALVWTDFDFDNGAGVAHSFNVRNDIGGIGIAKFDRGSAYGSPSKLSTVITIGNAADWPSNPEAIAAGLNSAISIVCHEQGHRWLAYIQFDIDGETKDDLLGRENAHWSFLTDTRTNGDGTFSSLMEGNAWRDAGAGTLTTIESEVNYFTPLDQYLMGLRSAEEVGDIPYLLTDPQLKQALREKSPVSGFSTTAMRKTTNVAQIVAHEGLRIPDVTAAPKSFRIAFILVEERGSALSSATLEKIGRYRDSLVSYFSLATGRRASLNASLKD
jgi:hypothetical protein